MNKENPDEIVKRIREKLPDDEIPESLLPENVMQKIKAGQNINIQQNLNIDVNSYRDKIRSHRMRMLKISGLAASIAVAMLCITFALGTNSGKLLDTDKTGINKESSKWQDSQYTGSTASGIENNEYSGSVYEVISEIYYLKNIAISDRFMVRYMGYKVVDNKLTICLVYDNFRKSYTDAGDVENKNVESNNVYDNIINLEYDITDLTKPKLMD